MHVTRTQGVVSNENSAEVCPSQHPRRQAYFHYHGHPAFFVITYVEQNLAGGHFTPDMSVACSNETGNYWEVSVDCQQAIGVPCSSRETMCAVDSDFSADLSLSDGRPPALIGHTHIHTHMRTAQAAAFIGDR